MSLEPGTRLGPYQILAPLGAGGMGEVYRATDTALGRDVAIKVLPGQVAADPERLARFRREAQLLAALNHPNIAAIHGLDQSDDKPFLVLELVEGEDLAQRLKRGPLPVDEALAIAKQVAAALEEAHEHGIVHRDLKPANIKLTPDGKVKVLDFGLAKAYSGDAHGAAAVDVSHSPTQTRAGTDPGVILGTAAYMSPEQARGKPVDRRADIWGLGCVLYELIAGKPAFGGETVTDCMVAIMTKEPDWTALPSGSPLDLLRRCLQKDPRLRLRDAGDAFPYGQPLRDSVHAPAIDSRGPWRRVAPWLLGGVAAILAGSAGFQLRQPQPAGLVPVRASLSLPPKATLSLSRGSAVALSPDGRRVVFIAASDGRSELYQRPLDQFESTPIRGTEGATNPFFSPDGEWVGFFAGGKLKRVALQGGEPVTVCDADNARGEAWAADDTIFFTPVSGSGILRVPAAGGKPQPVTTLQKGEFSHRWPQPLPGGKAVLFTVWNDVGFEDGRIVAQLLETGERRTLLQGGSYAHYAPPGPGRPGHLIYARAGGLMAVPFDAAGLRITGTPVPILEGVVTNLSGGAHFSFSGDGALVYVPGVMGDVHRSLAWVRPDGTRDSVIAVPGLSVYFKLSPDGRRLVRSNPMGPTRDIWVHDLERGTDTRLTYGPNDNRPVWSPDGKRIAFSSGLPTEELLWKPADGSGSPERLARSSHYLFPESFSWDGKLLAFAELDPSFSADIWVMSVEGDRTPRPFLRTPFSESSAVFSPDGRWLAYQSNESGRFEVFVQPYPAGGRKWQASTQGGQVPNWSSDGKTIFYRNRNAMMAVSLRPGAASGSSETPELSVDKPRVLFEGPYEVFYDLAADGRFAMIPIDRDVVAPNISLVLNWFEDGRFRASKN